MIILDWLWIVAIKSVIPSALPRIRIHSFNQLLRQACCGLPGSHDSLILGMCAGSQLETEQP